MIAHHGLGQADFGGSICQDATGNPVNCGAVQGSQPPFITAPGVPLDAAPPGTPSQWSLTIPNAAPPTATGSANTGGTGSGSDICHSIFGTGAFGTTVCSSWFWIALVVLGGYVVIKVIRR